MAYRAITIKATNVFKNGMVYHNDQTNTQRKPAFTLLSNYGKYVLSIAVIINLLNALLFIPHVMLCYTTHLLSCS